MKMELECALEQVQDNDLDASLLAVWFHQGRDEVLNDLQYSSQCWVIEHEDALPALWHRAYPADPTLALFVFLSLCSKNREIQACARKRMTPKNCLAMMDPNALLNRTPIHWCIDYASETDLIYFLTQLLQAPSGNRDWSKEAWLYACKQDKKNHVRALKRAYGATSELSVSALHDYAVAHQRMDYLPYIRSAHTSINWQHAVIICKSIADTRTTPQWIDRALTAWRQYEIDQSCPKAWWLQTQRIFDALAKGQHFDECIALCEWIQSTISYQLYQSLQHHYASGIKHLLKTAIRAGERRLISPILTMATECATQKRSSLLTALGLQPESSTVHQEWRAEIRQHIVDGLLGAHPLVHTTLHLLDAREESWGCIHQALKLSSDADKVSDAEMYLRNQAYEKLHRILLELSPAEKKTVFTEENVLRLLTHCRSSERAYTCLSQLFMYQDISVIDVITIYLNAMTEPSKTIDYQLMYRLLAQLFRFTDNALTRLLDAHTVCDLLDVTSLPDVLKPIIHEWMQCFMTPHEWQIITNSSWHKLIIQLEEIHQTMITIQDSARLHTINETISGLGEYLAAGRVTNQVDVTSYIGALLRAIKAFTNTSDSKHNQQSVVTSTYPGVGRLTSSAGPAAAVSSSGLSNKP